MLEYDVVIAGEGTAGAVAVLAATKGEQLRVPLIEAGFYVGGLSTTGITRGGFFDNNYGQVIGGIPNELAKKCKEMAGRGYFQYHGDGDKWIIGLASVDPETAKYVMKKELYDAGCDAMLFSILDNVKMENGRIRHTKVVSRLGKQQASADYFIDAIGELILADMVGVKWEHGSDESITQSASNMFRVLGVDMDKYEVFLDWYTNTDNQDPWKREAGATRRGIEYWCLWKSDGFENIPKSLGIYYHGKNDDVILSCTSTYINPLDIMETNKASYQLREEIFHMVDYLKHNVVGSENTYTAAAYDLAARETRRMHGDYILTMEDIVNHKHFEDAIGMGAYPPDVYPPIGIIHIPSTRKFDSRSDGACDIPLRCLTFSVANLIVAGKCVPAASEAQPVTRGTGPCMVEGQGAGTAAALATESGIEDIHSLDIKKLRQIPKEQSVIFDD